VEIAVVVIFPMIVVMMVGVYGDNNVSGALGW
jgi:nitrate reductase NapE component